VLLLEGPDVPLEQASAKITDFGLARRLLPSDTPAGDSDGRGLTMTGQVMGTPGYMAPEQTRGRADAVGPACDGYALGVTLYECLVGRPPFRGSSPLETVHLMLSGDPLPPSRLRRDLPADLETICLKCLEREPARRYSSASLLADDLERFLAKKSI